MWQWKRISITATAWVAFVPMLAAADGLGVRTDGWALSSGSRSDVVAWHRVPGPVRSGGTVFEHRRTSALHPHHEQETYLTLKGGGLRVGDDPNMVGAFLGVELGGAIEKVFEIGFSVDYYYREVENALVLDQPTVADLPAQVLSSEHTSAHLIPVGLSMRLRLPTGSLWPFVSGTLAYEWLYLENIGGMGNQFLNELAVDETLDGWAVQAGGGLGLQLAPKVGLVAEAGYHWGAPSQELVADGRPVELRVNMDGPYLRGGIRFGL